jgi:hypothetical protein
MPKHKSRRGHRKSRHTRRHIRRGGFSMNPFAKKVNQAMPSANVVPTATPTPMTMKNRMSGALSKITPSQAKLNYLKNKSRKAYNLAKTGAQSVGSAVGKVGNTVGKVGYGALSTTGQIASSVAKSPLAMAGLLSSSF